MDQLPASLAKNWIQTVATQSCLKELSITMLGISRDQFTLPDEIFSQENLNTLSVKADRLVGRFVWMSSNPVINSVSLRVLELLHVGISDEVLDSLLSTCSLLEKIHLSRCKGFTTIKVKNLPYLHELNLKLVVPYDILKIDDVPSLRVFSYKLLRINPVTLNVDSFRTLTELLLHNMIIDEVAIVDMIKSKLPFLKNLDLILGTVGVRKFRILQVFR